MSVQDKLRLHLADKTVTWREDVPHALAAQTPEGLFLSFGGAVTASTVIDAYNAGRGSRITLLHEGPVGDVARRSAARFGVTLLDAATLPEPAPTTLAETLAPRAALPAPAPEPLLPAHVEPAPVVTPGVAPVAPPVVTPVADPPALPPLPWDASVPPADPFSTAQVTLEVTPHEILAMPWTLHPDTPVEEHLEITETKRGPRGTLRPTTDLHPDSKHWGLPWPRPRTPADGLAIADPKIWSNPQRLESLHASFDARAAKLAGPGPAPEGGSWLKRLQFDGA